jgi:hypothetical protein
VSLRGLLSVLEGGTRVPLVASLNT